MASKENIAPRPSRSREPSREPYELRHRKSSAAELDEMRQKLNQAEDERDEILMEEQRLSTRVLALAQRVFKDYFDARKDRLLNAPLQFDDQIMEEKRRRQIELQQQIKEERERIRKAEKSAKHDEQLKRKIDKERQRKAELEQRVERKTAVLKALLDSMENGSDSE